MKNIQALLLSCQCTFCIMLVKGQGKAGRHENKQKKKKKSRSRSFPVYEHILIQKVYLSTCGLKCFGS